MHVLTAAPRPHRYESGWPLIADDDLPRMHVLTAAPRPHRYESGGRHTIVARGRCMIAHSFTGLIFGPAQALHGCTYVIDARLSADGLLEDSELACTRAEAESALADALRVYHQRNLDDLAELAGENTTCERVGRALWCRMAAALPFSSRSGLVPISELEIVVRESDVAWAAYRRQLGPPPPACGAAVVLDLDSLGGSARMEEASADGRSGDTPSGIVHRTPLSAITSVMPYLLAVASAQPAAEALAALRRLGIDADAQPVVMLSPDVAGLSGSNGGAAQPGTALGATPTSTAAFWAAAARSIGRAPLGAPAADGMAARPLLVVSASAATHAAVQASGVAVAPSPLVTATCAWDRATLAGLGCCRARDDGPEARVAYLAAKRPIDAAAYNREVLAALERALKQRVPRSTVTSRPHPGARPTMTATLRVFDLGAGTLSMLPVVVAAAARAGYDALEYAAFDSDADLLEAAAAALITSHGYVVVGTPVPAGDRGSRGARRTQSASEPSILHHLVSGQLGSPLRVSLALYVANVLDLDLHVRAEARPPAPPAPPAPLSPPDLLVASGFADLLPPSQLAALLARLAPRGLAYMPITFAGVTRTVPAADGHGSTPSDARVIAAYHAHLEAQGQYIDPRPFCDALGAVGGEVLCKGPSPWQIGPEEPLHAWMVDFLAAGTAPALWAAGWDAAAWRISLLERRALIVAENVDLLLQLPPPAAAHGAATAAATAAVAATTATAAAAATAARRSYSGLEFVAPRQVQLVERTFPAGGLAAGAVEIRTLTSMISTGTELLIYRGEFDASDEPLDATIASFSEAGLSYPMAYGYSLVGEIAAVGAGVPARSVGSLVFAFAPHATAALVDAGAYQAVPAGISAADAAFLPAAETAISIVHDAHPRAAETVHVFGCGVIGLLVLAALKALGVRAVAVDPDASRRALALSLGASAAYPPATAPRRAADVTIECSGNPAALQGAIDGALDSGRVVLASWYGRKPVGLVLGTRFHRSHLEIIASQVSVITGPHASRWSKGRRFGAAWDLLRAFKPASTLPVLTLPLQRAPEAYELLDRNAATVVLLSYGEGDKGAPFGLSHRSRI